MFVKVVKNPVDENGENISRELTKEESKKQLHKELDPFFDAIIKYYDDLEKSGKWKPKK